MGRYSKIISDMWGDPEFDELDAEGKLFYIYLLTNDACNLAGYYRIKPKTVAIETGIPADKVNALLVKDDITLWRYDKTTRQIFIKSYMKYNNVSNSLQYRAIATQIRPLTLSKLHIDFICALIKVTKGSAIPYLPGELLKQILTLCKSERDSGNTKRAIKAEIVISNINTYLNSSNNKYMETNTDTETDTDKAGIDTVSIPY